MKLLQSHLRDVELILAARGVVVNCEAIAECTKARQNAARRRGRVGGNSGLRAGDPNAICKLRASRDAGCHAGGIAGLVSWLPTVRRMRPSRPWRDVVRVLNHDHAGAWTVERLRQRCWNAPVARTVTIVL